MCIRVDANGDGKGAGTHVSVFAYLMKGRYDDNLPWPFTGEVITTLLNQLEDENHHTRTLKFPKDNEATRRVVNDDMAPTGCGGPKFIAYNKLHFDARQICYFLKNDCLYFQIIVKAAEPVKPWLTCTV